MGSSALNWTPIGSGRPAPIASAPLLAQRQLERAFFAEFVADRLGDGEPAGWAATALVLSIAAAGTLLQGALIYAGLRPLLGAA